MKKNIKHLGLAAIAMVLIFQCCKKETYEITTNEPVKQTENNISDESQTFLPKYGTLLYPFPGGDRKYAVSFSIGNKVYTGFGFGDYGPAKDFYAWDPSEANVSIQDNVWTKLADFPGSCPQGISLGFAVNGKGYVLPNAYNYNQNAYNQNENLVDEFWEFDPETNAWTKKSDPPIELLRSSACGFSIGTKLYIGTGENYEPQWIAYKDFWEWDQTTDTWTRKADFPGEPRAGSAGFSIGDKGYIGLGGVEDQMGGAIFYQDFWEYNPETDKWIQKADFPGSQQMGAVAFYAGNKGYVTAGWGSDIYAGSISPQDIWEWNQAENSWTMVGYFAGTPRTGAVGGSIGNWGYLIGGRNISTSWETEPILKDFWLFDFTPN